jgi:hypothetical protein
VKNPTTQPSYRRALWPCALLLLSPTLAGCGGGGKAAPAAVVQPAAVTLSGTVQDAAGTALSGYTVVYTPGTTTAHARQAEDTTSVLTTVTDSQGHYSFSIPAAQITTSATLAVFDTSGNQVQSQTLTLDPTKSTQTTVVTVTPTTSNPITVGAPPAPPAPPV